MTITKWLTHIRAGDPEAFKDFYNAYAPSTIRTAIAITKNEELAKDALQETFIRVYRNIDAYNPERPFAPWFYRILINECMRVLKKESKSSKVNGVDLENTPIILKYVDGFTEKEIANILSLKHNTVKSRLYKGRIQLRKLLDDADSGGKVK